MGALTLSNSVNKDDIEAIRASGLFDEAWYRETYPDVAIIEMDPVEHYLWLGAALKRDPSASFSTRGYLAAYPDVAAAKLNPLLHYIMHGQEEGRSPSPTLKAIAHTVAEQVDIVIPIFDALADVQRCLTSIVDAKTASKSRVILVDDGSSKETNAWLVSFCQKNRDRFSLVTHETNRGYTIAVNAGLKKSSASFVVLLNSDTIVTDGWLDALVRCAHSHPKVGIVGPLSNAASWQSVPKIFDDSGDFSLNLLPAAFTPARMASIVASLSRREYPRVKFVNGFCFMIKREVMEKIGYMDEATFPQGYGEENDFCIRASNGGFELAIADDCYVFHAKSKSFGHERRKTLSASASRLLAEKHGAEKIAAFLKQTKSVTSLTALREAIAERLASNNTWHSDASRSKIVYLLPVSGGGGGSHSVVQEAAEMRRLGVDAKVALHAHHLQRFTGMYPGLDGKELFLAVDYSHIGPALTEYDIVVATVFTSVPYLRAVQVHNPRARLFYYVQDYEPLFFPEGSPNWSLARDSYTDVPDATLFAKTHWIRQKVAKEHGVFVHKVSPSLDHSVYRPIPLSAQRRVTVQLSAMIRPQTPYRGAQRTMRVLRRLHDEFPGGLHTRVFGCSSEEIEKYELERGFDFENRGFLNREEVANVLQSSDVFFDLSDYQAFGRTALEAMACGCVPVVPLAGGADEFAADGINAVVLDTTDEDGVFEAASNLIRSASMREQMRIAAIETAARYSPTLAAASELRVFSMAREEAGLQQRPYLHILSEKRGDGRPTGSAYVRLLQPYMQPEIQKAWKVAVHSEGKLPELSDSGVAVLQRTVEHVPEIDLAAWIEAWRGRGNAIIYELDDDLLDGQALRDRGVKADVAIMRDRVELLARTSDIVVTSTKPLRKLLAKLNDRIEVVENYLDSKLWELETERDHVNAQYPRSDQQVKIGYIGTPSHKKDLELIRPAMLRLEQEYGLRISIEVIGAFSGTDVLFGERIPSPKSTEYPAFVRWLLKRVNWDIGLIPLVDDVFNASKSHLKFLEYAALDMAIVCSDTTSYRDVAEHGMNSLVSTNTEQSWYDSVRKLIEDASLRQMLSSRARNLVSSSYTIQGNSDRYLDVLRQASSIDVAPAVTAQYTG